MRRRSHHAPQIHPRPHPELVEGRGRASGGAGTTPSSFDKLRMRSVDAPSAAEPAIWPCRNSHLDSSHPDNPLPHLNNLSHLSPLRPNLAHTLPIAPPDAVMTSDERSNSWGAWGRPGSRRIADYRSGSGAMGWQCRRCSGASTLKGGPLEAPVKNPGTVARPRFHPIHHFSRPRSRHRRDAEPAAHRAFRGILASLPGKSSNDSPNHPAHLLSLLGPDSPPTQ